VSSWASSLLRILPSRPLSPWTCNSSIRLWRQWDLLTLFWKVGRE
jgi:hypothetical protein